MDRMPRRPAPKPLKLVPPPGPWLVFRFEESCGKMWRIEVRTRGEKTETRRVAVRNL